MPNRRRPDMELAKKQCPHCGRNNLTKGASRYIEMCGSCFKFLMGEKLSDQWGLYMKFAIEGTHKDFVVWLQNKIELRFKTNADAKTKLVERRRIYEEKKW